MMSAGFVSALALNCISGNWDTRIGTALLFSSAPNDGRHDGRDGRGDVCECVEDAPRVPGEVLCTRPRATAPLAVRASTPLGSSCAEQARSPPKTN